MSGPVFRAQGLTKTYGTGEAEVHALRGVRDRIDNLDLAGVLKTRE